MSRMARIDKYLIAYVIIYLLTLITLFFKKAADLSEIIALLIIFGGLFTSIAYISSKSAIPLYRDKPAQKYETTVILLLLLEFIVFITFYKDLILLFNDHLEANKRLYNVVTGILKLIFIVMATILVYKYFYRFNLGDWGISGKKQSYFSRNSVIIFVTFLLLITLLQYFISNGFKPVKTGDYSTYQIIIGLPLNFIWLFLTVGMVEEFFFRSFLQSRLAVLLNSQIGGIVFSALFFGMAHAPGIYLRGGGEIANLGTEPSLLLSVGYSIVALSVAGIFLSVIWLKTKNFWLIASIHACVDLLPSLSRFIDTWEI